MNNANIFVNAIKSTSLVQKHYHNIRMSSKNKQMYSFKI